jgi:hypothetical protein
MKTHLAFLLVLAAGLLAPAIPAAAQSRNLYDWNWATRLGATTLPGASNPALPPSFTQPESMAADAAGNVIIAGLYDPDVVFGPSTPSYQNATGPLGALESSYVAKYTPAGAFAWSLNLTSNGDTRVTDVTVDATGNSYVIGRYYQQLRIDGATVALANTSTSCFLAKISPTGTLLWASTIESNVATTGRFLIQRLAVDAVGNSVVQGEFEGSVTINGTTFAGVSSTLHALVLRYNQLGGIIGAFAAYTTGAEIDRGFTGIALAATGETYLSGYITAAATMQFGTLPALTGPTNANAAGFVLKLSSANVPAWLVSTVGPARQSTTTASGQSIDKITIGPQDRCYAVGGLIGSSMSFGTSTLNTGNPATATGRDLFLARIAPNGTVESLVGGGGTTKVLGFALGSQGQATIATAGGLDWGNVRLPGATWPTSTNTGLVQLDAAGVPQRGWQAGGRFFTAAVAVDGLNQPVLAGTYFETGPFTFGTQRLTSPYLWNTVIARTGSVVLATRQAAQVAGLEVYPNPARNVVEVRTTNAVSVRVQLLDALGRTVRAQALPAGQTRMDLTGLAPGSYTLLVQQGDARSYRHLTVEP